MTRRNREEVSAIAFASSLSTVVGGPGTTATVRNACSVPCAVASISSKLVTSSFGDCADADQAVVAKAKHETSSQSLVVIQRKTHTSRQKGPPPPPRHSTKQIMSAETVSTKNPPPDVSHPHVPSGFWKSTPSRHTTSTAPPDRCNRLALRAGDYPFKAFVARSMTHPQKRTRLLREQRRACKSRQYQSTPGTRPQPLQTGPLQPNQTTPSSDGSAVKKHPFCVACCMLHAASFQGTLRCQLHPREH